MKIVIPISIGELLDKISILEIKSLFTDSEYVKKELEELKLIKNTLTQYTLNYEIDLRRVNEKLWKIEDRIREKEKLSEFDDEFIQLARSVYLTNDERAKIKKEINDLVNSDYKEIKLY
jgi:hypothetical protein